MRQTPKRSARGGVGRRKGGGQKKKTLQVSFVFVFFFPTCHSLMRSLSSARVQSIKQHYFSDVISGTKNVTVLSCRRFCLIDVITCVISSSSDRFMTQVMTSSLTCWLATSGAAALGKEVLSSLGVSLTSSRYLQP